MALILGAYLGNAVAAAPLPTDSRKILTARNYVVFAMERSEEEFSSDSRAVAFLKLFVGEIS